MAHAIDSALPFPPVRPGDSLGMPHSPSPVRRPGARIGATRFLDAARRWDAAVVAEALRSNPEFATVADRNGRTGLHLCAGATVTTARRPVAASVATARALLRAGAVIDAVQEIPDEGELFPARPLWHAVARGQNRTLARFLLEQGANPNWCFWAVVWKDDVVTARLLHDHQANLNLTFRGETPLLYAARIHRPRMSRWLLRHGADPNIADREGHTPLTVAVQRRHALPEIEELLRHGADPDCRAKDGSTARDLSMRRRNPALIQLLTRYSTQVS